MKQNETSTGALCRWYLSSCKVVFAIYDTNQRFLYACTPEIKRELKSLFSLLTIHFINLPYVSASMPKSVVLRSSTSHSNSNDYCTQFHYVQFEQQLQ
jgi:hypothetical protein